MRIGDAHLTYCTNIHPGESWAEVADNLRTHVAAVKARVSPDAPFGVGLRLSARAAQELTDGALGELKALLAAHDLYVFTINGFPYGTFHGAPVKEAVYRPDWREPERLAYTKQLVDLLRAVLPDGIDGSISTVPGCFRPRGEAPGALDDIAAGLRAAAEYCAGTRITIAIEPEPCCLIETLDEAIAFFQAHLRGVPNLGLCLDACHAAVEYEDLPAAIARLAEARIPIAKLQLSAGLRVAPVGPAQRAALVRYADSVYLHQVVARRGDQLTRYVDLPAALEDRATVDQPGQRGGFHEWRVHFHVPIVRDQLGPFASTQDFLAALLALHRASPLSPHLEVETYTWDVLPPELRDLPIADAVAGELRWVVERLVEQPS